MHVRCTHVSIGWERGLLLSGVMFDVLCDVIFDDALDSLEDGRRVCIGSRWRLHNDHELLRFWMELSFCSFPGFVCIQHHFETFGDIVSYSRGVPD